MPGKYTPQEAQALTGIAFNVWATRPRNRRESVDLESEVQEITDAYDVIKAFILAMDP